MVPILAERDLLSTAPRMKIFQNKITLNYHQLIQTLFIEIEEACYHFCYYPLPPFNKKELLNLISFQAVCWVVG